MKMQTAAEPPLQFQWGWAEIIALTVLICFNSLQPDHFREKKKYKRSGRLLRRTLSFISCLPGERWAFFLFKRELPSFSFLRIVFQRQKHFPSKHMRLQVNKLWACQLLARFNLGLNVVNGNMNHFQHWNRCTVWSRSRQLGAAGWWWGGNTACDKHREGLIS